ncbi:MAG: hypothetical protein V4508_08370 [Pseudomonadota bacterium]
MASIVRNLSINPKRSHLYIPQGLFTGLLSEYYSTMQLTIPLFSNFEDQKVEWLETEWGTFLALMHIHLGKKLKQTAKNPLIGFCNWLGGSSKAKTNAITMLVFDFPARFDIDKLAPQFAYIEHASYLTYDPETGAEIFRVLAPLIKPIKYEKFLVLKPFIQKWADGNGSHPPSNPSSYEVGRYLGFPDYSKVGDAGPNLESASPGWMLDENAFVELMNTGVLTLA